MVDAARGIGAVNPGAGEIFQILRDGRARTKAELATLTGLARSTVSTRVDALLATGLIHPAGEAVSTGGRPPARIAFNPSAGVVIAIDLGATHATVAHVAAAANSTNRNTATANGTDNGTAAADSAATAAEIGVGSCWSFQGVVALPPLPLSAAPQLCQIQPTLASPSTRAETI